MEFELLTEEPSQNDQVLVPFFEKSFTGTQWMPQAKLDAFSGKAKEVYSVLLHPPQTQVHLIGLGKRDHEAQSHGIFRNFAIKNKSVIGTHLLVDLRHLPGPMIYQSVLGLALSEYAIGTYKTEADKVKSLTHVQILVTDSGQNLSKEMAEAQLTASTINRICHLVDAPGNIKTPEYLGQWALKSGQTYGYRVELLNQKDLEKHGLQALLAVGQGSEHPPVLIKAQYTHPKRQSGTFDMGLVGKGVTFDTGGLSIKRSANMHYMKSDMGGAAAVLGAIELIARLELPLNVVAVVPVAENSVDAKSIRPGDVISSYARKTIEIIDTDAEGRLILADALSYIQKNYSPQTLIDLATLTGSCVATLGSSAAGLFTNNEALASDLSQAGERTHERVWRLPLWEDYQEALDSDIADIKNYSGKPVAGAITAAKFLQYFTQDHPNWAHLDIAGVAFGDVDHAKMKAATGFGVRLLLSFAQSMITS